MKKNLFALVILAATLFSARADLMYYEGFNYADGPTTNVSAGVWAIHSTSAGVNDSYILNHRLQVSGNTSTNAPRQADVNRKFCLGSCVYTNAGTVLYASYTINCTNLPTTISNYIAHFWNSQNNFYARVFSIIGTTPGTWRLGISGNNNAVSKIFPYDLAPNVDYQVVVQWDPVTLFAGTLWVNPISQGDISVTSSDAVTAPAAITGYAFRQAAGATSFFANITNLATATTWQEAATNVWQTNAVAPIVAASPVSRTNFVTDNVSLFSVAAGQGLASLTYQWTKNGANVGNGNGNSNVFNIASAAVSDSGNYAVIVTTPYGLSVTSATAFLWVTNAPVPPTVTTQPASNTVAFAHQNVSLTVVATGPPTLSYQWFQNNVAISDTANFSGTTTPTLTITDVTATNSTTGTFRVNVTNPYGTTPSSNAVVNVTNPPAVSIAFLRTLVDTNYIATNSTALWQVTGTVTTFTNLTTANTSSYYLQDGTAGINMFMTFGSTFRPALGDEVTFVGFLSSFGSTLELEADPVSNPATGPTVLSNNIALLPAPKVIPFSITNNLAFSETNLEGSVVMLTNVFFPPGATNSSTANTTIVVTNAGGETFSLLFSAQDLDTTGRTLPDFAWTVTGIFTQNNNNTNAVRNAGYQVTVTRFSDIVTDAPPAVTSSVSRSGNNSTITWTAVPYSYSYSVLAASNITSPFTPVKTGLTFTNTSGTYTDVSVGTQKYYRVVSP
jgi:hypothetical protein